MYPLASFALKAMKVPLCEGHCMSKIIIDEDLKLQTYNCCKINVQVLQLKHAIKKKEYTR